MEKVKLNEVYCTECKETKSEKEFYKRFITINSYGIKDASCVVTEFLEYQGICKECLIKEFQASLENFKGDVKEAVKYICSKYDLPYDEQLIKYNTSKTGELKNYIRTISSLKQYENKGFVDIRESNIKMTSKDEVENLSDLDFINKDIIEIRQKIMDYMKTGEVNMHGKWMNSLRDALQLKDKLENNIDYSIKKLDLKDDDIIVLNMGKNGTLDEVEFQIKSIRKIVKNEIIPILPNIEMSILSK